MITIAPSILAADQAHVGDEVRAIERAGADWVHIDVMDGRFVPNITFGIPLVRSLRPVTELTLDCHLMIVEPERYIEDFARAGADVITVHAEACPHLDRTLHQIKEAGCRAGVALNPATPLHALDYVTELADLVLIMTVNPGFGGQSFIKGMLPKIKAARDLFDKANNPVDIQVDGGVNSSTASEVLHAGANVLVAGSAVFSVPSSQYGERISSLRPSHGV